MKEWNELLLHINEFVYMKEEEEIVIRYSPNAEAAKAAYERGLQFAGDGEHAKWLYDIALDCVRRMSPEDRDYVTKNLYTSEYHMGYAMGIRNMYIHPSKKHAYFEADVVSSSIMKRIFSLLSPFYDFRNSRCEAFFESFGVKQLLEQYGQRYPELVEAFIIEVTGKRASNEKVDDGERLKQRLREKVGKEEFFHIFKEAYHYYNENEKQNKREDWYWATNFSGVKAILFPLETNQMNALRKLNYFWYVESGGAKSVTDCRTFIDKKLGLRAEDADFMARCFFEVCSPYRNGTWKDLSFYTTELDYGLQWRLEQQGIKTIGALCSKSESELLELAGITDEDVSDIKSCLRMWLEERNLSNNKDK